jgi:recombination protein RecA
MSSSLRDFLSRAREGGPAAGARIVSLAELGERRAESLSIPAPRWQLDELTGRLTELSGVGAVASLTAATSLLLEAQGRGEPSAWITLATASFYPPDLDDAGVDLDALVVVRAPTALALVRAADRLLRSGAFGLLVLDLGAGDISMAAQGRLVGLAQHHDAALVAITEKPARAASLGSMVSLRAEAVRERVIGRKHFRVAVRAVKDKRRGPGWEELAEAAGPAGLY